MKLEEILIKLEKIREVLDSSYPELTQDKVKHTLARSAKVSEEYGELMDEILHHLDLRKLSSKKYQAGNIGKEFSDTLISLLLLGMSLDIDIPKELDSRINEKYKELTEQ